jgi:citrate lyase beta subunit
MSLKQRPRRSWLLTLTADEHKVGKAAQTNADVLILDLSDSVTPDLKAVARRRVVEWFRSGHPFGDKQLVIKPNNLRSPWGRDDIDAIAALRADAVYYPEAESAEELQLVCDALDAAGSAAEIVVLLENPRSYVNIKNLCTVRRVTTLCHAQGDLAMNLGVVLTDTRETMLYTAAQTVLFARAYGLTAIDTILPSDLRDPALTARYVEISKRLGFHACSTFYAPHVDTINRLLTPSAGQLAEAREVVLGYEAARARGSAAFVHSSGAWITLHHYRMARRLLDDYSP